VGTRRAVAYGVPGKIAEKEETEVPPSDFPSGPADPGPSDDFDAATAGPPGITGRRI